MRLLRLLVALACLGGCGYKGALYLPENKPHAHKPATILLPEPAPDRPQPAQSVPSPK